MPLDPRPARLLTSREVCKIIGSLLGGLASSTEGNEILFDALDHFHEYRTEYDVIWSALRNSKLQVHEQSIKQ